MPGRRFEGSALDSIGKCVAISRMRMTVGRMSINKYTV